MTPLLHVTPALTASAAAPAVHATLPVLLLGASATRLRALAALPVLLLGPPATFLWALAALPVLLLRAPATLQVPHRTPAVVPALLRTPAALPLLLRAPAAHPALLLWAPAAAVVSAAVLRMTRLLMAPIDVCLTLHRPASVTVRSGPPQLLLLLLLVGVMLRAWLHRWRRELLLLVAALVLPLVLAVAASA
jgi:hypothetical protein